MKHFLWIMTILLISCASNANKSEQFVRQGESDEYREVSDHLDALENEQKAITRLEVAADAYLQSPTPSAKKEYEEKRHALRALRERNKANNLPIGPEMPAGNDLKQEIAMLKQNHDAVSDQVRALTKKRSDIVTAETLGEQRKNPTLAVAESATNPAPTPSKPIVPETSPVQPYNNDVTDQQVPKPVIPTPDVNAEVVEIKPDSVPPQPMTPEIKATTPAVLPDPEVTVIGKTDPVTSISPSRPTVTSQPPVNPVVNPPEHTATPAVSEPDDEDIARIDHRRFAKPNKDKELARTEPSLIAKPSKTEMGSAQGVYRVLIIANSDYRDASDNWQALTTPQDNAQALMRVLRQDYGVDRDNILYCPNASRKKMSQAFVQLDQMVQAQDSLLICYFGHAALDDQEQSWVSVDIKNSGDQHLLPNEELYSTLSDLGAKVKHLLVITSVAFDKKFLSSKAASAKQKGTAAVTKMNNTRSIRILMADAEEYSDKIYKNSGLSKFAYLLLQGLKKGKIVAASELADAVKKGGVKAYYGTLKGTKDQGGELVFVPAQSRAQSDEEDSSSAEEE